MPRSSLLNRANVSFTLLAAGLAGSATAAAAVITSVDPPQGFEELARARAIVVDIYYGGRKVGESLATIRPGSLEFRDSQKVAALIPDALDRARLASALSGALATNSVLVCSEASSSQCGSLAPNEAGIIFDEQHFRV